MSNPSTILVADDDRAIRTVLSQALGRLGHVVRTTSNAATLWRWVSDGEGDLVITDVVMPDDNGLDMVPRIKKLRPELRIIVMSAQNTLLTAVKATERGAFEYLPKPFDLRELVALVERALTAPHAGAAVPLVNGEEDEQLPVIGRSPAMQEIYRVLARLMGTDLTVMITGESGTGKELVARALHAQSERHQALFVELNCAAIPEELIESELFGHLPGAFPGAQEAKEGKFSRADQGTLFLDEVGDMSLKTQAKVLRTLDEGRFEVLGANALATADVRIIAATNKNLEEEITRGNFREDLFYRLNVIPFYVPPLRERKEDIPMLARHFLAEFANAYGRKCRDFSPEALAGLAGYNWPGNVRELRNLVERIAIMTPSARVIERRHLPPLLRGRRAAAETDFTSLHEARSAYERDYILKKLEENGGNMTRTAEVLGLERSHLYRKMKSLGMTESDSGAGGEK